MSDQSIANIARDLAKAMVQRARSRSVEDNKLVLQAQTDLCAEYAAECEEAARKLEQER